MVLKAILFNLCGFVLVVFTSAIEIYLDVEIFVTSARQIFLLTALITGRVELLTTDFIITGGIININVGY